MQIKGTSSDVGRVSVSSRPSTSSHGSAPDDYEGLGDVYVWGDVISDGAGRASNDKDVGPFSSRSDILIPKLLESNLVLDVQHVACGVRHAALVTRQGEVFTWGEEYGGRLGHGIGSDVIHPRLVESLSASDAEFAACGEFHTCVISGTGELYTWGDGTHNAGLLGHGSDVSHWIPKRVSGPLEGLQVAYVTCGTWHTALITSTGQLYTFGEGTFGVLGHGNRESVSQPKEVESLMGLRTIAVACGVWHTAAVVEVIVTQSSASVPSGKLFTWGDGDKYRLGHGNKEPRLKPTCVPSLIDYNFHKLACGHSLTIGLTTSGQVFTMGSTVYGQLGNPQSDGKLPSLVEDKLASESVMEVACGAYHVAVLTNKCEVYTWGKGANGRLGHGDLEDRKMPTVVEAMKDRQVKRVACGSNFTAAVCTHKWISGAEQSQCSSCRQPFGFTRKRHNCYNCGLVHCHSCSSRKAPKAALAPNPGKPYRVCDTCYVKLSKMSESGGTNNKKNAADKVDVKSKAGLLSSLELIRILDTKTTKQGKKIDTLSLMRAPQSTAMLQLKDIGLAGGFNFQRALPRPVHASAVHSVNHSRAVSPFSRKTSPPRSATPLPTTSGLSFSESIADSLTKTNELLNLEVVKLRTEVDSLRKRCELQELELQKSAKKIQDTMALAAEESSKSKAAKEVIKSLTGQLKDMAEKLPRETYESNEIKSGHLANGFDTHAKGGHHLSEDASNGSKLSLPVSAPSNVSNGNSCANYTPSPNAATKMNSQLQNHRPLSSIDSEERNSTSERTSTRDAALLASKMLDLESRGCDPSYNDENGFGSPNSSGNQVEAEWIEQYEPGVYITLVRLLDGTQDLRRVRFSRRRFGVNQAESWWSENREKVYERYNVHGSDTASQSVLSSR